MRGGHVPRRSHGHGDANPFLGTANPAVEHEIAAPHTRLARDPVDPDVAHQLVHDELQLDGNARMHLATS